MYDTTNTNFKASDFHANTLFKVNQLIVSGFVIVSLTRGETNIKRELISVGVEQKPYDGTGLL
jgi:hypothetical protein